VPAGWTPDQIKQFQDYWDTEFAGDLARRRRAKFVPGEAAAKVHQTKEPEQKNDFDEWLARIICYAFSVPPQWAVKLMNRATADNQSEQAEDEGLEPTKEWVKDLCDEIIAEEFTSPDLELHWLDEDADARQSEAALESRVKLGALTLNEMRGALGLDPYANAAADRPMVLTATGYVPIEANADGQGGAADAEQARPQRNGSAERAGAQSPTTPGALIQKYNPDQPRVPAGNSDGGQWTSEGGSGGSEDRHVVSDTTPDNTWIPSVQYAGGIEDDEGENRFTGQSLEPTPGEAARLAVAEGFWRDAVSRVQAVDPDWKPTPGIYETVEGEIADLEAQTQEAEDRLRQLARVGIGPGPFAGRSIPARGPERDFTSEERSEINRIGAETGCHTCGTKDPETKRENFVPDHQLPSALNPIGRAQRLYPQCLTCSRRQGGWITGNGGGE
jgi:hypothetical protein